LWCRGTYLEEKGIKSVATVTKGTLNVIYHDMKNPSDTQQHLQRLSDEELGQLDDFLGSDSTPEECMFPVEMLDGYMTALIVGPEAIEPDIWIPYIWDQERQAKPDFSSEVEEKKIQELLVRHMNTIAQQFNEDPEDFMPLYEQFAYGDEEERRIAIENWALGFTVGIELTHGSWNSFLEDEETAQLVLPMFVLAKITDDFDDLTEVEIFGLLQLIPDFVINIYSYWNRED